MTIYLTFNDSPSGLYTSQVIDTVYFLKTRLNQPVRLLAIVSGRGFFKKRREIKNLLPDALIIPMFPGIRRWKMNIPVMRLLLSFLKPEAIIGRSVLATQIAMRSTKVKIVYDGRGAIAAEWNEYNVINDNYLRSSIARLEKECIQNSSFRIAVSHKLIENWSTYYDYKSKNHVVIPCTLSRNAQRIEITLDAIREARFDLGYKENDIIFVYSGSIAGWQSFDLVSQYISNTLEINTNIQFLFLSEVTVITTKLVQKYPSNIKQMHIKPAEVPAILVACDYGILIREKSVTNSVASPIKFAEYLACGLKVIISADLGDYSDFTLSNNCGYIFPSLPGLTRPQIAEKKRIHLLAVAHFSKEQYYNQFKTILTKNLLHE